MRKSTLMQFLGDGYYGYGRHNYYPDAPPSSYEPHINIIAVFKIKWKYTKVYSVMGKMINKMFGKEVFKGRYIKN